MQLISGSRQTNGIGYRGLIIGKRDLRPHNISHGGLVNFHVRHARNLFGAIRASPTGSVNP